MTGMLGRLARTSLVTTTLLALALTVLLAVVTSADVRISIAVGLLGTVLAMLISLSAELHAKIDLVDTKLHAKHDDVERKLHAKHDELQKSQDAVARVAAAPIERVLKMPHVAQPILDIIASAERAQARSQLMSDLMTEAVKQASQRIDAVGSGCFRCERDQELRFVKLVLKQTDHVRAIANRGLDWYATPASRAYFDAYGERAQEKEVQVTRVFVVKREDWSGMEAVLDEERKRGVEAHRVLDTEVPTVCDRAIVLFDEVLLHLKAPQEEGFDQRAVQFVDSPEAIEEAISSFDTALKAAKANAR